MPRPRPLRAAQANVGRARRTRTKKRQKKETVTRTVIRTQTEPLPSRTSSTIDMAKAGDWTRRISEYVKSGKPTKGKYVTPTLLTKKIEKGIAARVPTAEFNLHMCDLIDAGVACVGKKVKRFGTPEARDATRKKAKKGPNGGKEDARQRVQGWIDARVKGAKAPMHLTKALVNQLKQRQARRGLTVPGIHATLITMAAQGRFTMEWRPTGKGWKHHDAMTEATEFMVQEGWETVEAAQEIKRKAEQNITTWTHETDPTQRVMLDFGEGWGGAREGMGRVATVVGIDRERQYKGEKEGMTVPDLLLDFRQGKGKLVRYAAQQALAREEEVMSAHFSPGCGKRGRINRLEATQGEDRGFGENAGKPEDEEETESLEEIAAGINDMSSRNKKFVYTLEQPEQSSLDADLKRLLPGVRRVSLAYCSYGVDWNKPTWIYTNLTPEEWTPRIPKEHCEHCRMNTMHKVRIVRRRPPAVDNRPPPSIPGFTATAAKNRVPPDLAEEWARATLARWT